MADFQKETERAEEYCRHNDMQIVRQLGFGWDGIVFAIRGSTRPTSAVKVFRHDSLYQRERDVYLRLRQHAVSSVAQFSVPELVRFDDERWVIEMSIVSPPFVLDFAGAYLDRKPDYPEDVYEEWLSEKQEQFGERWDEVASVMARFRRWGIWLADVKPGNIEFGDELPD